MQEGVTVARRDVMLHAMTKVLAPVDSVLTDCCSTAWLVGKASSQSCMKTVPGCHLLTTPCPALFWVACTCVSARGHASVCVNACRQRCSGHCGQPWTARCQLLLWQPAAPCSPAYARRRLHAPGTGPACAQAQVICLHVGDASTVAQTSRMQRSSPIALHWPSLCPCTTRGCL